MYCTALRDPAHYPPLVEARTFGFVGAALVSITLLTNTKNRLRARLKRQKEYLVLAVAAIRTLATVDELTARFPTLFARKQKSARSGQLAEMHT